MSRNKALMASALVKDLTELIEKHGDLPIMVGSGHTLTSPGRPRVMAAVREEHVKTMFMCHRPLLSDFDTTRVIHLG